MRTLAATAAVAFATADETSLMQDLMRRSSATKLESSTTRQGSTSKLLDSAVSMIKNGVTPDVISFVDATNQDINDDVLVAIQSEHDIDQAYITTLCQDFVNAVNALEDSAATIANHATNSVSAQTLHHTCRSEEALRCAKSRRCEEQLRQRWETVKHEERIMREIHGHIHDEWCIHPPFFAEIDVWLSHPFNWAQTSPYPVLDLPQDVHDFRGVSVTYFNEYMEQKIIVQHAWEAYNEKLVECADLEESWEERIPGCDQAQNDAREHACQHSQTTRSAREAFGQEWERITTLFEEARTVKTANEQARKNEWETLKIVQCLLDHVHSSVITSINTGAPCPTVDSDPEGVILAIEDCHIVTRGCSNASLTHHLCLDWCDPPDIPPLPPVEEPACTPAFVAKEQAQFLAEIQTSYSYDLESNTDYRVLDESGTMISDDALTNYETVLSEAGWAGCAPPLVCVDCALSQTQAPIHESTEGAHVCHLHEEYLSPGQSNADTFRCLDGTCIRQAGRCNDVRNCVDNSDESGCDADSNHFVPAYLSQSSTCPDDFHDDVHFICANNQCIEKVGLCNGVNNCADGSDELQCSGMVKVEVEATSGRHITVETLQMNTGVFHDREYNFQSLGHFQGKIFIKYSNDDKATEHNKVMTKLRTFEPVTVFIVKLDPQEVSWLIPQGFTRSSREGVSFNGVRSTRHKEWDESLLTMDSFSATSVWKKTFPPGTISIPGNSGGDGSFLIFVDEPTLEDEYDDRLVAYWELGSCGTHGDDHNNHWCGGLSEFNCAVTVETDLCPSGTAELVQTYGTGQHPSSTYYERNGCSYIWFAQYRCARVVPEIGGEAEFIGCFTDDASRDLGAMVGSLDDSTTNTFELCRARCGTSEYMSLQYGGECFCSNSYATGPAYRHVDESNCNSVNEPCSSHSYNCGGSWHQAIYHINRIVHWDMIAHHDMFSGQLFPVTARDTMLVNENDNTAVTFMNIGNLNLADYDNGGKYHFRLVYTDVEQGHAACNAGMAVPSGTQEAEWTQTSWITTDRVLGFQAISPSDLANNAGTEGCGFTGLSKSGSAGTVLDGSHTHHYFFGSVGTTGGSFFNSIPALSGGKAQTMTLYVERV